MEEKELLYLAKEYASLWRYLRRIALLALLAGEYLNDRKVAEALALLHDFSLAFREVYGSPSEEAFEKIYPLKASEDLEALRLKRFASIALAIYVIRPLEKILDRLLSRLSIALGVRSGRSEVDEAKRSVYGLMNTVDLLYTYLVSRDSPVDEEAYEKIKEILSGDLFQDALIARECSKKIFGLCLQESLEEKLRKTSLRLAKRYRNKEISLAERPPKVIV